jgi:ADP-ribosylglycohydrolase
MSTSQDVHVRDRFRGCLLGLATGDAVGTTVEFSPRGSFPPVTDMIGRGPFGLEPGQWTDDTSMALCLATSLLERDGFDPRDQMERYCRWQEEGTSAAPDAASTSAAPSAPRCNASARRVTPWRARGIPARRATAASCVWRRCRCSSTRT